MRQLRRILFCLFCLGLLAGLVGCGEFSGEPQRSGPAGPADRYDEPPEDPQTLCELSCERVYANLSAGGCQQQFHHEDNTAMSESSCVEGCLEDDLFRGGQWCVATEAECKAHPIEMVEECLPDDYVHPHCEDEGVWDQTAEQMEEEVVDLVNEHRDNGAVCRGTQMPSVGPVTMNETLRCAARLHSIDMKDNIGELDHTSSDGRSPTDRAADAGYEGGVAENIARGYPTPEDVVNGWLSSTTGHCENLMNGSHSEIGVGMIDNWWTQKFGG